jgi:hypothetical protein
MKNLGLWSIVSIVAVFCVATAIPSPLQTFKALSSFDGKIGDVANGPSSNASHVGAQLAAPYSLRQAPFVSTKG